MNIQEWVVGTLRVRIDDCTSESIERYRWSSGFPTFLYLAIIHWNNCSIMLILLRQYPWRLSLRGMNHTFCEPVYICWSFSRRSLLCYNAPRLVVCEGPLIIVRYASSCFSRITRSLDDPVSGPSSVPPPARWTCWVIMLLFSSYSSHCVQEVSIPFQRIICVFCQHLMAEQGYAVLKLRYQMPCLVLFWRKYCWVCNVGMLYWIDRFLVVLVFKCEFWRKWQQSTTFPTAS